MCRSPQGDVGLALLMLVWGTARSVPPLQPPLLRRCPWGTCAPKSAPCPHVPCSTLPSATPKVPPTSEEAVGAEGDLSPAWNPNCPQILHP